MKVLVVGGGGREHALCWTISGSPLVDTLWCAPGNAGIVQDAECVDIAADDIDGLVAFAVDNEVELVVIGPEIPLVLGLADRLQAKNIRAFGPSAAAAVLEGSKGYMKDLCADTISRRQLTVGSRRRPRQRHSLPSAVRRLWSRRTGSPRVKA